MVCYSEVVVWSPLLSCTFLPTTDPPEIGFDPQFYSVSESDSYVEVCVEVLSGSTIESFTATVSTADGSATGKYYVDNHLCYWLQMEWC